MNTKYKRIFSVLLTLIMLVTAVPLGTFTSFAETVSSHHTHSYTLKFDKTSHWEACSCGDKISFEAHTPGDWIVDVAATADSEGAEHRECTVCGYVTETEVIPKLHTHHFVLKYNDKYHWEWCDCFYDTGYKPHSAGDWIVDVPATAESEGSRHKECKVCGYVMKTETIPKLHVHSYTWRSDDNNHWKACSCGDKLVLAPHTPGGWISDIPATETAEGAKHKECTVCGFITETAVIDKIPASHTHSYGETWTYDGTNHWKECICGEKSFADSHTPGQWIVDKEPTLTEEGSKHIECTVCKYVLETESIDKLTETIIKGDLDNSGKVTASDARLALRISAKLEPVDEYRLKAGDLNGDGKITASEARLILRYSAHLEASL